MQTYKMIDNAWDSGRLLGYLFYYERSRRFFTELLSDLDEWSAPFMFSGLVAQGIYSIDSFWTDKFVAQRIVPRDRQNLGSILKENGLKEYDEFKLLKFSEGHCAQDEIFIERVDNDLIVPEIKERFDRKVSDCVATNNGHVMVFFKDGTAADIDVSFAVSGNRIFDNILKDEELFKSVQVAPGGNGIEWGRERNITAEQLYDLLGQCRFDYADVISFLNQKHSDTAKVCEMLNCSRQYVNQLVASGKLVPIRSVSNNSIFLKSDIEREDN